MALVEIGPHAPTIAGGREALRRVTASRVTAVVAFNDLIAIGLMQQAADVGTRDPGGTQRGGFDDIFGSELIVPALTTVRTDLQLAGRWAVSMTLGDAAGPGEETDAGLLPAVLVVRGSTGPSPAPRG